MSKQTTFSRFSILLNASGLAIFYSTLIAGKVGLVILILSILMIFLFEYLFKFSEVKGINPYLLFTLTPLLLTKYTSITDFNIRVISFFLLAYIFNIAISNIKRDLRFSILPLNLLKIWLIAFLIFFAASYIVHLRGIHLSGDEPHYLMITQSLVEDGDFNLKNNVHDKTYFDYLPLEIRFHGIEKDGQYLSYHLPGLSFLLIPFYFLFKLSAGLIPPALFFRISAAFINAFFALLLFYVLKRQFPGRDRTGIWLLSLFIFPLVFHSIHLYPELPAAALFLGAYLFFFSPKKHLLATGALLSLVPWFHVKYLPPTIFFFLVMVYHLLKSSKPFPLNRGKIKSLLRLFLFPVIMGILLLIYSKTLYHTYNPANIFPKESYWNVPLLLRIKVFFSYFLDQRDGLLFYGPLFFMALFGFKGKLKNKKLLLGIAFSYILFHAFTSVRGAYAPAGRPLIFVSWVFIISIAQLYTFKWWHKILTGLSIFVVLWLFYYPLFIYQPVFSGTTDGTSGLYLFFGSNYLPLWEFFPSFLTSPQKIHWANYFWIGILIVLALIHYFKNSKIKFPFKYKHSAVFLLFLVSFYLYCFYPHIHLINKNKFTSKTVSFYNNSKNFRYLPESGRFRIKGGNNYDIYIDKKMMTKESLTFTFTHTDVVNLRIRNGRRLIFKSTAEKTNSAVIDMPSLSTLDVGSNLVSHIGIETRTKEKNAFLWLEIK
jgi:hypothetical protein